MGGEPDGRDRIRPLSKRLLGRHFDASTAQRLNQVNLRPDAIVADPGDGGRGFGQESTGQKVLGERQLPDRPAGLGYAESFLRGRLAQFRGPRRLDSLTDIAQGVADLAEGRQHRLFVCRGRLVLQRHGTLDARGAATEIEHGCAQVHAEARRGAGGREELG